MAPPEMPPSVTPPADQPAVPQPMTLAALQTYVDEVVRARGFTTDMNEVFVLLVEELGELATEFKHWVYYPDRFDRANLAFELADVLLYLLDLANGFGVGLAALWPEHEAANDERFAARRGGRSVAAHVQANFTLNRLVLHVEDKRRERGFEDTPERLLFLLTEEIGEVATELRKRWKGRGEVRAAGLELIDAVTYVCRLAGAFGVDLEAAVAEKERQNARRVWLY